MLKSRICQVISQYNLEIKYYQKDLIKAKTYLENNGILYAYSPKKDEIIVSHIGNKFTRFYTSNGNLRYECSCNKYYECEHVLPSLVYIKKYIKELDQVSSEGDDVRTLINKSCEELISYLYRLIGPELILQITYNNDFTTNVDRILLKLRKEKDPVFIYLSLVDLLAKVKYSTSTSSFDFNNKIYEIFGYLLKCPMAKVIEGVDSFVKSGSLKNISEKLKEYYEDFNEEESIYKIIEYIVNSIDNFKVMNQSFNIKDIESLIVIVISKMLRNNTKEELISFTKNFIDLPKVKVILYRTLYELERYDEIINYYNNDLNEEITDIYLHSLVKTNKVDSNYYLEMFINNPTFETFIMITNTGLFNDIDLLKKIACDKSNYQDKILILDHLMDYRKLFEVCKEKGISEVKNYFIKIYSVLGIELFEYYQRELEKMMINKVDYNEFSKYFNDFKLVDFGEFYLFNFLKYILNAVKFDYYTEARIKRYLEGLIV